MYITLELAIEFYILVKLYCVYEDYPNSIIKKAGAIVGMFASAASIIVSVIKAVVVLLR